MLTVGVEEFQALVREAMATLPEVHMRQLKNVAILYESDPTPEQRHKLALRDDQTLFGLYEGVPLSQRQGADRIYPDKITLFIHPLCASVATRVALKEQIRHTLWHEIAHYYGLDHARIHELEG